MTYWPIVAAVMFLSLAGCGAMKIQNPIDELPREVNHPRHIHEVQVGYLNLEDIVSKLYEEDNFEGNKELISGFLKSELKTPSLLKDVKKLDETVNLFLSLAENYDSCDYESYKSLAQNYRAVDGRSHDLFERRRSIDRMIFDLALEHARECGPKYVELFEQIAERPAAKVVTQIVDEVLKGLDASSLLVGEDETGASHYKMEDVIKSELGRLDLSNHAFYTIVKNIENLVQGKSEAKFFYPELSTSKSALPVLPRQFEENIFNKYLMVPCEQYNELFRDVFASARFDAMIDDPEVAPIYPSSSARFDRAFVQYRVCKHLANSADRGDILSMVKQVAQSLIRQP